MCVSQKVRERKKEQYFVRFPFLRKKNRSNLQVFSLLPSLLIVRLNISHYQVEGRNLIDFTEEQQSMRRRKEGREEEKPVLKQLKNHTNINYKHYFLISIRLVGCYHRRHPHLPKKHEIFGHKSKLCC